MHKVLLSVMNYVYKAFNPTILNLTIVLKKAKFKIVGLKAGTISITLW
jgi:hypothetical protein